MTVIETGKRCFPYELWIGSALVDRFRTWSGADYAGREILAGRSLVNYHMPIGCRVQPRLEVA